MSKNEKIEYLEHQKKQFIIAIGILNTVIGNIDSMLLKIKKENE